MIQRKYLLVSLISLTSCKCALFKQVSDQSVTLSTYKIIQVGSTASQRAFLTLPAQKIYRSNDSWIQPLNSDIARIFHPSTNPFFDHGVCQRWILGDENNDIVGRVAAFVNYKTAHSFEQPTGGMGFFECVNDQTAADALFTQCQQWLADQGMQAMDGPINFGNRDQWWGLLVQGFTPPSYATNYHPAYYKPLFEAYGFQPYFNQYTYQKDLREDFSRGFSVKAARLQADPAYRFEHLSLQHMDRYAQDFQTIYNQTWSKREGVEPMSSEQVQALIQKMKPIIDEKLLWYAYHEGRPIAFALCIPDINPYFKPLSGQLNWWGKLQIAYQKTLSPPHKAVCIAFAVIPAYQREGVGTALLSTVAQAAHHLAYQQLEICWVGDFNPPMMGLMDNMGATIVKQHVTYRKLFDAEKPFKRSPLFYGKSRPL